MSRFRLLLALPFMLVGIGLLIGVGVKASQDRALIERAQHLTGVVVAAPDNGVPVVEARDDAGRAVRVEGTISTSPSPYDVGERLGVYFDPATGESLIDSFVERWFVILLLGGFGLVASTIGAVFAASAVRNRRMRPAGFSQQETISTVRKSTANDVVRRL
ncbi:MAG: DUF3592 domain-containing protein [Reyranellaceae bacterium]